MKSVKHISGFFFFVFFLSVSLSAQYEQIPLTWNTYTSGNNFVANEYLESGQNGYVELNPYQTASNSFIIGLNDTPNSIVSSIRYGVWYSNGNWLEIVDGNPTVVSNAPLVGNEIISVRRIGNSYEILRDGIPVLPAKTLTPYPKEYPAVYDVSGVGIDEDFYFFREPVAEYSTTHHGTVPNGSYAFVFAQEYLARGEDGFIDLQTDIDLSGYLEVRFYNRRQKDGGSQVGILRYHPSNGRIYWLYPGGSWTSRWFGNPGNGDISRVRLERKGSKLIFHGGFNGLELLDEIYVDPNIDLYPCVVNWYGYDAFSLMKLSFNRKGNSCQTNDYFDINRPEFTDYEHVHYLDTELEEDDWNYVYTRTFDGTGEGKCHVLTESRSYFDDLGRPIQSQSKDYLTGKIWASQTLYDDYQRGAISTLTAPTFKDKIGFKEDFVLNNLGQPYSPADYDGSNTFTPVPVGKQPGTLGWWYSENNVEEPWQATTDYPYSRTEFSKLTGAPRRSASPGDKYKMGSGHEVLSFTMPAGNEIAQLFNNTHPMCLLAGDATYDPTGQITARCGAGTTYEPKYLKTISRDPDGKLTIAFTDLDGNEVGKCINNPYTTGGIPVTFTVPKSENGKNSYIDIHTSSFVNTVNFAPSPSGSLSYEIYKLYDDAFVVASSDASRTLNSGFYRVVNKSTDADLDISYNLGYRDYSLNIHNSAGQMIASVAPNDVDMNGNQSNFSYYRYNSLGQLIWEQTPDGGKTYFLYRLDGSIRFSVNAEQLKEGEFSYTKYDEFNRILEVGEATWTSNFKDNIPQLLSELNMKVDINNWPSTSPAGSCTPTTAAPCTDEETFYLYDLPDAGWTNSTYPQRYIGGRLSKTWNDDETIWYSYDEFGRSTWEAREVTHSTSYPNNPDNIGVKITSYEYDLVGNVTEVIYQEGASDEYRHHYGYDMNGQLRSVSGRGDGDVNTAPDLHAKYTYTPSGKMDKYTIADGLEEQHYVYTLQGQLKAINPLDMLDPDYSNATYSNTFGMVLSYHLADYKPANGLWKDTKDLPTSHSQFNLFDGRISGVRWKARTGSVGYINYSGHKSYRLKYNYRNELIEAFHGNIIPYSDPNYAGKNSLVTDYYMQAPSYDANGNILTLRRWGEGNYKLLDDLSYNYTTTGGQNKLTHIADGYSSPDKGDIRTQGTGNYDYNDIGQLTEDTSENRTIIYDAYGKVKEIREQSTNTLKVEYFYGPDGQRIKKIDHSINLLTVTWYARNGSGSVQSIYDWIGSTASGGIVLQNGQKEIPLYAGSRIGTASPGASSSYSYSYELKDHLGTVRAVIKDNGSGAVDVTSYADYYPFGWEMPGRNGSDGDAYRYGYQGEFAEKDPETGWNAFELRSYDARVGRWMTMDPYYQYHSPYLAMGNSPFISIDPDGGSVTSTHTDKNGNVLAVYNDGDTNIYRHNDISSPEEWHGNILSANLGQKIQFGLAEKVGETLIWDSFYSHEYGRSFGKIDFQSFAGKEGLLDFSNKIALYHRNHDEVQTLLYYMKNAGTGWNEIFDFKSEGSKGMVGDVLLNHRYRGSQVAPGIFASARDIGNINAGYIAGVFGIGQLESLKMMGMFNANGNGLNLNLLRQLGTNWNPPYGETMNSHKMQKLGYKYGLSDKTNFFRKAKGY